MRCAHGAASLTVSEAARNGFEWRRSVDQQRCSERLLQREWTALGGKVRRRYGQEGRSGPKQ